MAVQLWICEDKPSNPSNSPGRIKSTTSSFPFGSKLSNFALPERKAIIPLNGLPAWYIASPFWRILFRLTNKASSPISDRGSPLGMHKLSRLQFAQVTAVLVVDAFDVIEFIIILKTRKRVLRSKWDQFIKNLTGSQGIPHTSGRPTYRRDSFSHLKAYKLSGISLIRRGKCIFCCR